MTKFYAADDVIAQAPLPGGVEITAEQYGQALAAMMAGQRVVVRNGAMEIVTPEPEPQPEPPPPPEPTLDDYRIAVDAHVEAVARARGYNNAATLASYVTSTVTAWAAEAAAFIPWRDSVWVYTFDQLAAVEGGAQPPASPAALVAALPAPPWPLS